MAIELNPKSRATFNWAAKRAAADIPSAEKKLAELREALALAEYARDVGYWDNSYAHALRKAALLERIAELESAIPVAEAELAEAIRLRPQWLAIVTQHEAVM